MTGQDFRPEDFSSDLWLRLRAYMERRLAELRAKNDTTLSHEATMRLRGRIAEVKSFLALSEATPPTDANDA